MAFNIWGDEEERRRAIEAVDEFGIGTSNMADPEFLDMLAKSQTVGDEEWRKERDAMLAAASFIPFYGQIGRGAVAGGKALSPAVRKINEMLFKKKVPVLSKGTGKTPKGEPVPLFRNGKPVTDNKGNIVYRTESKVSPEKVGGIAAATTLASAPVIDKKVAQVEKARQMEQQQNIFGDRPGGVTTDADAASLYDTAPFISQQQQQQKQEPSIWENMMKPVEGGAGDWDTGLYRLSEMMAHMGTPLSKRGTSPAERWTKAKTEDEKVKAAIEKERIKAGKGDKDKGLTFPQFTGNFAEALTTFQEGTWNPFDNYTEEQMANVRNKAWQVHQKNPGASIEDILNALLAEGQI